MGTLSTTVFSKFKDLTMYLVINIYVCCVLPLIYPEYVLASKIYLHLLLTMDIYFCFVLNNSKYFFELIGRYISLLEL